MFWKNYGSFIERLWGNFFMAIVFGFLLSFLTANVGERAGGWSLAVYIISGLISTFFYVYLIFLIVWEQGAKDRIKADGGRIETGREYGFKIGLVYASPAVIGTALNLILVLIMVKGGASGQVWSGIQAVTGMVSLILSMPFCGFLLAIFGSLGKNLAGDSLLFYSLILFLFSLVHTALIYASYAIGWEGKLKAIAYKAKKKQ